MRSLWLSAVALAAATGVHAEPLTYPGALLKAQTTAPVLQARTLQAEAARAAARPAAALPDPKLALGLDNFPISGPPAGRFGADEMTAARVGVMQDVPNREKRRARGERAAADVGAAVAAGTVDARQVRVQTAVAWLDLYYGQQRLRALDDLLKSLAPLYAAAPSGVTSGAARPGQALEPDQLRAELEDRRSELAAAIAKARAQLARWTTIPAPEAAGQPPSLTVDPSALRQAIDSHPRLAAMNAATSQAEADVKLARAEKRPDWGWEVAYQRRDRMFGDMVSAGVTVQLPLFAKSRQDPRIAAKVASAAAVRAEREAARRELQADLEAALADHAMHHDQFLRARDTLLPLAKRRAELETASYGAGRASLADVVQAFHGLANAQLTFLDREAQTDIDAARITLTYGSEQ
ncbi:MAG: transporter [Phenylobacterium sp.]|nr:transporter [Phenylobacterium sp.]